MAKLDGDDQELTEDDASLVKAMLKRGDSQHNIAAYFGVDSRAISHVKTGKTFSQVAASGLNTLPPPGPYRPDPIYSAFYRRMVQVNHLWEKGEMRKAKAHMEMALRSPAISEEQTAIDEAADDLFRDEFGVMKDFE